MNHGALLPQSSYRADKNDMMKKLQSGSIKSIGKPKTIWK